MALSRLPARRHIVIQITQIVQSNLNELELLRL